MRPVLCIGQSLLNDQEHYRSFCPCNSLIIAAFRLTFIQSLQWICKGEVIEKYFKPLRSDINTMTEFNELEKKKSIPVMAKEQARESMCSHSTHPTYTCTHTKSESLCSPSYPPLITQQYMKSIVILCIYQVPHGKSG